MQCNNTTFQLHTLTLPLPLTCSTEYIQNTLQLHSIIIHKKNLLSYLSFFHYLGGYLCLRSGTTERIADRTQKKKKKKKNRKMVVESKPEIKFLLAFWFGIRK